MHKSEVKIFATNNLVRDYDIYKNYMTQRREFLKTNNSKPTDLLFPFGGRNKIRPSFNLTAKDRIAIIKWHCIATSYMIWQDCVKDCPVTRNGAISYKKVYDVSDDILKKFKYRVEKTLENTRCDLNNVYKSKHPDQDKEYDACRYLAMCWTYLDIVKDDKTQRYFPSLDTIKRAAKIFGYSESANPFEMNGIYWNRNKETKIMVEKKEVTYSLDLGTSIDELGFSTRTRNGLWRAGYRTLGDIVNLDYKALMKIRNLGLHSTREVLEKLNEIRSASESAIDIAEQVANEVEEEKDCGYPIENRMDALEANYKADFKKVCDTFKTEVNIMQDRIEEQFKQINALNNAVHTVEKAKVETNDDILTLVDKIIAKMEEKGVNDFSLGGKYSIEIHKESPIRNFSKVINYNGVRGE